jgi:hypothetical protein
MNARYYDPQIGQFLSPDTLVPDEKSFLSYNRYLYAMGNPLKYNDPTGHYSVEELQQHFGVNTFDELMALFGEGGRYEGNSGWYDILRAAQDGDRITATLPNPTLAISGSFMRDSEGHIQIDMGGGSTVPEWVFADFGDHRTGMTYNGRTVEYGMYRLDSATSSRWFTAISGNQAALDMPCNTWDCAAISLDATSLTATAFRDTSLLSTPVTGPLGLLGETYGEAIATSADLAGLGRTAQQRYLGKASDIDVAVGVATFAAGRVPVLGTLASAGQFVYDLASPFLPW